MGKRCGLHNILRIDIVVVLERLSGFFEQVHYHAPHVPFDKKLPKENKQQFAKQVLSSEAKKILRSMPGVMMEQFLYNFASRVADSRSRRAEVERLFLENLGTGSNITRSNASNVCSIDVTPYEHSLLTEPPMECCSAL